MPQEKALNKVFSNILKYIIIAFVDILLLVQWHRWRLKINVKRSRDCVYKVGVRPVAPLAQQQSGAWALQDKPGNTLGEYDWVISTAPSAQTLTLFQAALPDNSPLHTARMQGCYSLMIGFNKPWDKPWIAAKVRDNPIKWISINSTKPGRNNTVTAIVAHSRNNWADRHINDDIAAAQKFLLAQFEAVSGIDCRNADYISTHRWRYAIVEATEKSGFYLDSKQSIAATSDWASTSRIEEVWTNAVELAKNIARSLM